MDKDYMNYVLACWSFNVFLGSCTIAGEKTSDTMKNQFDQYAVTCVFCFNIYCLFQFDLFKKKKIYIYIACFNIYCYTTKIMFVTFVLIFKFILIYFLHVLFVLKIKGIFEKEKASTKVLKEVILFIYSINSLEKKKMF